MTPPDSEWLDAGPVAERSRQTLQEVRIGNKLFAVTFRDGSFHAISGRCNHVGGPLGKGELDPAGYVTCPWHYWKFHHATGRGEPGYEGDAVPVHETRVADGHLYIRAGATTKRTRKAHEPHPLTRMKSRGEPGGPAADAPLRVLGLSTTNMDEAHPRTSTSDALLETALEHARTAGCDTRLLRLSSLRFRACEGFYSKSANACTWPCSITQMDSEDEMTPVYEGLVGWCDVVLVATPIRWGGASSLYYKMVERLNCVQNQETIAQHHLIRNKVAAFIVTGGQDNVQAVVGQMLGFFSELGFQFPPFAFIAHSRGWSAEDMENNVREVLQSKELHEGARSLVARALETARALVCGQVAHALPARGGRKAHAPKATDSTDPSSGSR